MTDDLDRRLRARLEQLAGAVPIADEHLRPVSGVTVRPRHSTPSSPARFAVAGAALLVLVAVITVGTLGQSPSTGPSSPPVVPTATASVEPSPTPRMITTGEATWEVACNATSDADCDGAVGLFTNNLARSWKMIIDESDARLAVESRACPTFNGLTARQCWDVTAMRPSGPFCMVVANGANDPRYPAYFEIGGQDGAGRAGGLPAGWPVCLGEAATQPSGVGLPTPSVSCGELSANDCRAAVSAVLARVSGLNGSVNRVDLGSGVFCPTPGLLFVGTTCPGGSMRLPDGAQRIGHALVTFADSPLQAYLNVARNGQTIEDEYIRLAPPPPSPS